MALNTTGGTEGRRDVPPVESPGAEAAPRAGAGSGRWEEGAWGAPHHLSPRPPPPCAMRRAPCAADSRAKRAPESRPSPPPPRPRPLPPPPPTASANSAGFLTATLGARRSAPHAQPCFLF